MGATMKTLVLHYTTWPVRELHGAMMDVHATFEAQGYTWHVTRNPNMKELFTAAEASTGYVLTGVLKATAEDVISAAKELLQHQTKEGVDAVIRAVKEATGAPFN